MESYKFFKKKLKEKIDYKVSKTLKNSIKDILGDIKKDQSNEINNILFSPASASFDQYKNFEERGNTLKIYLEFMQKNFYKDNVIEYWRNVDKKIFFIFLSLFLLGLFFSLSSTSTLAGERLDKDNYFFFSKHLFFTTLSILLMIGISFINLNIIKKIVVPLFIIFLILLILVPFVGIEVKGAKRWLILSV